MEHRLSSSSAPIVVALCWRQLRVPLRALFTAPVEQMRASNDQSASVTYRATRCRNLVGNSQMQRECTCTQYAFGSSAAWGHALTIRPKAARTGDRVNPGGAGPAGCNRLRNPFPDHSPMKTMESPHRGNRFGGLLVGTNSLEVLVGNTVGVRVPPRARTKRQKCRLFRFWLLVRGHARRASRSRACPRPRCRRRPREARERVSQRRARRAWSRRSACGTSTSAAATGSHQTARREYRSRTCQ